MRRRRRRWSGLKDYLIGERKNANDKFALGKDLYAQMVKHTEQVDLPIEQIEAAGRADLERNTAALKAECATYPPKDARRLRCESVRPTSRQGGPVEAARKQLTMLKDFVDKNNVVSIPSNDEALVAEAPPYNRYNAAFIQVAGPYDKGVAAVYNIAPPDPKWSKAEQAAYIPSEATLCPLRCTRFGRDTSCNSCIRTPIPTSSKGCGWVMASPKAGRITAKK